MHSLKCIQKNPQRIEMLRNVWTVDLEKTRKLLTPCFSNCLTNTQCVQLKELVSMSIYNLESNKRPNAQKIWKTKDWKDWEIELDSTSFDAQKGLE